MPTLWAHQNYFNNSSTVVPQALADSGGGYPRWQASVIAVGVFPGQLQVLWERLIAWLRSWRRRQAPLVLVPPQSTLIQRIEALRTHPAYPHALQAVQQTATTLGFNRPEAWQGLSRVMKASPGVAENTYRHMRACELTRAASPSTLTNPDCNLLVELAYHEWSGGR